MQSQDLDALNMVVPYHRKFEKLSETLVCDERARKLLPRFPGALEFLGEVNSQGALGPVEIL